MVDRVIYFGFKITKYGVPPVKEKINNIRNTTEPKDVLELKSFLGLLNDKHCYILQKRFRNFTTSSPIVKAFESLNDTKT